MGKGGTRPFALIRTLNCTFRDTCIQVPDTGALEEIEGAAEESGKGQKKKMDMVRWIAVFQSYALAAEAAGVSFNDHSMMCEFTCCCTYRCRSGPFQPQCHT